MGQDHKERLKRKRRKARLKRKRLGAKQKSGPLPKA